MHIGRNPGLPGATAIVLILTLTSPVPAGLIGLELEFEEPVISLLPDGRAVVSVTDCATFNEPGLPLIPARRAALLLPPGESIVDLRVVASPLVSIAGSYQIAHALTPQPTSISAPPPATQPDAAVY